jgi:hypothetical protein
MDLTDTTTDEAGFWIVHQSLMSDGPAVGAGTRLKRVGLHYTQMRKLNRAGMGKPRKAVQKIVKTDRKCESQANVWLWNKAVAEL